jgi:rhodanese-related sulfurtransferase
MNKKIVLTVFVSMCFLSAMCLTRFVVTVRAGSGYTDVSVSEAKEMIDSNAELVILDVRNMWEYEYGHIRNAILIPLGELEGRLDELDDERETLVYCQSGGRSATASQILALNGFTKVYNMLGGFSAWRNAGYPVETVFYVLWIYSSPTGATFMVDGVSPTAPWSRTYDEGVSVSLEILEAHDGYVWSHWLEDGDTNRIKTVTMDTNIILTGIYDPIPKPVGGKAIPINMPIIRLELETRWIWLTTIILAIAVSTVAYVKKRKSDTRIIS